MSIGNRVREAREARGWSQQKLADEAGVSQTTIDKIEQGTTKRSRYLPYVAKALDLSIRDLSPELASEISVAEQENSPFPHWRFSPIPLFVSEPEIFQSDAGEILPMGAFSIGKKPFDKIACPPMLVGVPGAYALYVSVEDMIPEFLPADIACINPNLPPIPMTTCLFGGENNGIQMRVLARLMGISREYFEIITWRHDPAKPNTLPSFRLHRRDWNIAHRVVAKYYRY